MYLTSDAVIAATKDTMEDTIKYIDEKYGSAVGYLHEVGPHSPCDFTQHKPLCGTNNYDLLYMGEDSCILSQVWYHTPDRHDSHGCRGQRKNVP